MSVYRLRSWFIGSPILCAALILSSAVAHAQKLKAEDVVAKHLESIGTAEARAANKGRVIQGASVVKRKIGDVGESKGGAVMASQGSSSLIGVIMGPQDYSNERMAFDGKKLSLGEFRPGVRTRLGAFMLTHDVLFKDGLIGGALSTAWPLLDLSSHNAKVRYAGTKKIDGRSMHVLEYDAKSGGNLEIRMYFDAETFQHTRTEYKEDISAPTVSTPEMAARQQGTHLRFTEEFSDFRKEGDLTLPHVYQIELVVDTPNNPLLQDWILTLSKFSFNLSLDPKQFDVNAK
jgi:hypothetical protein